MIPLIVSNTGPLIALAGIGEVKLLAGLALRVCVAEAVRDEILAGAGKAGAETFLQNPWLEILPNPPLHNDPWLALELDKGEAATIALARQLSATAVVIDERKGRRVATMIYQMTVIGTGGILLKAKFEGLILRVEPYLSAIRANGYYIGHNLFSGILHAAGE